MADFATDTGAAGRSSRLRSPGCSVLASFWCCHRCRRNHSLEGDLGGVPFDSAAGCAFTANALAAFPLTADALAMDGGGVGGVLIPERSRSSFVNCSGVLFYRRADQAESAS